MSLQKDVEHHRREIMRGVVDAITEKELSTRLERSLQKGEPLRVKLGVDATASMLHLGFMVVLNKLRTFQDLGHTAVLIIGDGTALVGDPTGKNKTRPQLSEEEVDRHAEGYLAQVSKVLDLEKLEVRRNGEWLKKMGFQDLIRLSARATVAQMLERDDFSRRYKDGRPISIHEFLYPLLQGLDSVVVEADVELGGTDQLFNLLVGRDLQGQEGQRPQICLTTPLLVGLDGQQKMSKSAGNTIAIDEAAEEIFLKVMRLDDALMRDYFLLATRIEEAEIDALFAKGLNPRDLKEVLGKEIVRTYHDDEAAERAAETFRRVVSNRELPEDLTTCILGAGDRGEGGGFPLLDVMMKAFAFKSRGEARRQVAQGAVRLDDQRLDDVHLELEVRGGEILRVGRKKVIRLDLAE